MLPLLSIPANLLVSIMGEAQCLVAGDADWVGRIADRTETKRYDVVGTIQP
jgi:hypothetical protein